MEYSIVIHNPCNTGNKVVFTDPTRKTLGPFTITIDWNAEWIELPETLVD